MGDRSFYDIDLADWEIRKLAYFRKEQKAMANFRFVAYGYYASHGGKEKIENFQPLPLIDQNNKVKVVKKSFEEWAKLNKIANK